MQPVGQHPSPLAHAVMGALAHAAVQVPPLESVAEVHVMVAEHVVGHAPATPVEMAVSQVSPASTTPLPQREAQSLSLVALQLEGQQRSPPVQLVIAVDSHAAAHVPARASDAVAHAIVEGEHVVGHAPVIPVEMAVSQVSPTSTRPLPQFEEHTPAAQLCPDEHARPHTPQLVVETRRSTSQPLLATPSQSAKPIAQVKPHAPEEHVAVALARVGHAAPQLPQLATLDRRSTSQPSLAPRLQSAKPVAQVKPHAPEEHVAVAFAGDAHGRSHAPQ